MTKIEKITENTFIPISLMATIAGGVVWLTAILYKTDANASEIESIKGTNKEVLKLLQDQNLIVIDRLGRIETKLENLTQSKGR
jgi:hypothetical protein